MTVELFHPEALLDRELDAQLTPAEAEQLDRHLHECDACRLERALRQSVALPLSLEEAQLAQRAAGRAAEQFLRPVSARKLASARPLRWGSLGANVALVALGVVAVGGWLAFRSRAKGPTPSATAAAPSPQLSGSNGALAGSPPTPVLGTAAEAKEAIPVPQALSPAPPGPSTISLERPAEGPGELFARANRARRQDQSDSAASLYRDLQTRFPKSNEASVSCVTLGRLMLDRLNQPSGALAQFERYLKAVPGGSLREEAIIGRALALGRLGRRAEEQIAWRQLLQEYPDSMYSARARARLAP